MAKLAEREEICRTESSTTGGDGNNVVGVPEGFGGVEARALESGSERYRGGVVLPVDCLSECGSLEAAVRADSVVAVHQDAPNGPR